MSRLDESFGGLSKNPTSTTPEPLSTRDWLLIGAALFGFGYLVYRKQEEALAESKASTP